jgi:hypothetical protein
MAIFANVDVSSGEAILRDASKRIVDDDDAAGDCC